MPTTECSSLKMNLKFILIIMIPTLRWYSETYFKYGYEVKFYNYTLESLVSPGPSGKCSNVIDVALL